MPNTMPVYFCTSKDFLSQILFSYPSTLTAMQLVWILFKLWYKWWFWNRRTLKYTAISIYVVVCSIVLGDIHKTAATSSTWNPNISFIQMARHRRSSLYGRGIVNFADNYSLRSHIPLRSCLVGLRLWSDNVNWNSCMEGDVTIGFPPQTGKLRTESSRTDQQQLGEITL